MRTLIANRITTTAPQLANVDRQLAPQLTRDALAEAVAAVPDDFFIPLLRQGRGGEPEFGARLRRRRAAYVAFLWKRLKDPRPFLDAQPASAA